MIRILLLGRNFIDFPQNSKRFGQFVIMESNVVLGIATIKNLYNDKGEKII